ncbi:MAG: phosphomethylpyrimidine synthase ThiC [Planctomycetes bacterium]|nr:phosphomethylpyrimidine synthase ThiC [Planctomycetota bacterium]
MRQLESAKRGRVTPQMEAVARAEGIAPGALLENIKQGRAVLLSNSQRWRSVSAKRQPLQDKLRPDSIGRVPTPTGINSESGAKSTGIPQRVICGVGAGLRVKVNANIGTSSEYHNPQDELRKLKTAQEAQADTVMDLSTGGNIKYVRQLILKNSKVPVGTVPIYEAAMCAGSPKNMIPHIGNIRAKDMFATIEDHCCSGVDFITVHCGVTKAVLKDLSEDGRVGGMVSRGGTILAAWMKLHKQENPLYERFDDLLDIARKYDVTLSLGDGLRPGALADSFDRAQVHELMELAGLAKRARQADVQVMIEGPGHVPMHHVQAQVQLQKKLCDGAPFYVLGPLVTDSAPGYDRITSAIGAALAGWAGADFICYVTPMEHLGLPMEEHVREGVIAARIAAQAADIARGNPKAWEKDRHFSELRRKCDWEKQIGLSIDPAKSRQYRQLRRLTHAGNRKRRQQRLTGCSMCGELCVYGLDNNGDSLLSSRT